MHLRFHKNNSETVGSVTKLFGSGRFGIFSPSEHELVSNALGFAPGVMLSAQSCQERDRNPGTLIL